MANTISKSIISSLKPGGTPQSMKVWMGFMLLLQSLATIVPSMIFSSVNIIDIVILSLVGLLVALCLAIRKNELQIKLIWLIYICSIVILIIGGLNYHSHRGDIVVALGWSVAMYIIERRFYISFSQYVLAMMLGLVGWAICIYYSMTTPPISSSNAWPIITTGIFFCIVNSYIIITDYKHGRHQQDYFERHFTKMEELTAVLSRVLMIDKPIEDVLWNITKECTQLLGLEDMVIYKYDYKKHVLLQVAAYGDKQERDATIKDPIEIEPGKGVVGKAFKTMQPVCIDDTTQYNEYILDDRSRLSELAVPIIVGEKVFGVIDSEHSQKGYYKGPYIQLFNVIASFCSIKVAQEDVRAQQVESEKNRLETQKIKELEQLKSRFITNISHDLKTPLSLILGPANQIHNKTDDKFVRQQALYIIKNTDHLMSMVEQLLQLNMLDKGDIVLRSDTIEMSQMLNNLEVQYTPLAEESGITLDVKYDANLLITTDGFKLSQCIHNLLQNAFKHTSRGGKISLSAIAVQDGNIEISVKDTGVGIKAEEQEKVFERFYKTDVNNHKGTGIGLSLVKEYTTQLNGKVILNSAPGIGSTFTICLPVGMDNIAEQNHKPKPINNSVVVDDKQPLVLIAEDHEELNSFLAGSLQQEGFRSIQAYNGKDAMKLIEEHLPDIIISDLMMPEMTGEELVAHVKSSDKTGHIPILILSAKNQIDDRVDLYSRGADNYISKPFKMEEIIAIVDNTLKQRKKLRDSFYDSYMSNDESAALISNGSREKLKQEHLSPLVQQCRDYVLANLDSPELNVNSMGANVGMGRNKLQKEIKAATGLTPVEFIRSIRLHEAYRLMKENNHYNISEVAYMTGFSNLSYFSRSFKAQFGAAPSEATV